MPLMILPNEIPAAGSLYRPDPVMTHQPPAVSNCNYSQLLGAGAPVAVKGRWTNAQGRTNVQNNTQPLINLQSTWFAEALLHIAGAMCNAIQWI
jgi:hypothetical protein